jgi:hypothetical protein
VFSTQIETAICEENVQIVFSTPIETTYCEENAQIVFLPQIGPDLAFLFRNNPVDWIEFCVGD